MPVDFGRPQEGHVKVAAVVEVKGVAQRVDGLGVHRRGKAQPLHRHAPQGAGLQGQQGGDALFVCHAPHPRGQADAQVDDTALAQLHGRPAGDDFAHGKLHGLQGVHRAADRAVQLRPVGRGIALAGGRLHHVVHQRAVDAHPPGMEGAALHNALHLHHHDAAAVAGGGGDFKLRAGEGLPLHRDVALLVGVAAPDKADIDGEGGVEELCLAAQLQQPHHLPALGPGLAVDLAALHPGVCIGAQAHAGENAALFGGDGPVEVHHHPQGQAVGCHLVLGGQGAQPGRVAQVAGDDGTQQALIGHLVHAHLAAGVVAAADAGDAGEVCGRAGLPEARAQGGEQGVGSAVRPKAPEGDGVPVLDQLCRLGCCDEVCHGDSPFFSVMVSILLIHM